MFLSLRCVFRSVSYAMQRIGIAILVAIGWIVSQLIAVMVIGNNSSLD